MEKLNGVILGFRRGPNILYPDQALIKVEGIKKGENRKLVGYDVEYVDKYGNKYIGKVVRHHGNNNVVRVKFEPNLPGDSIGGKVVLTKPKS